MILSDNETKIDLLNNGVIADAVVALIKETPEKPLSIGIHGDWGAGKSSILEMIEERLLCEDKILSIKFNGWQYQGFEDAKIALIESIVNELISKKSLANTAKDTVKKILKNIDWLKVAKGSASVALTLATGIPPVSLIKDGIDLIRGVIDDKDKTGAAIDQFGNMIDGYMTGDNSTIREIAEFRDSFDELIEKAKINQLVVLIDDLDRCLPKTTIETLEAIRLLMFTKKTAFVIAADESMIEYSVREHFPTSSGYGISRDLSNKYLEKLIQVPFRIPALGKLEAKTYILLLLIISELDDRTDDVEKLIQVSLDKIKKPWLNNYINTEDIKLLLKPIEFDLVVGKLQIAHQISNMLTEKTKGNPRKIKRYLNTLMLRYNIAKLRGFEEVDVKLDCLAKIMLIEQFEPDIYNDIAHSLDDNSGICEQLAKFEEYIESKKDDEFENEKWLSSDVMKDWATVEPKLSNVDLRPYYFINQEGKNSYYGLANNPKLEELYQKMISGDMQVAAIKNDIDKLNIDEAKSIYEMLIEEVARRNDYTDDQPEIPGIKALISTREDLQEEFISFVSEIAPDKSGAWIVSGWDGVLTSQDAINRHTVYLKQIKDKGTKRMEIIAAQVLKRKE